MSNYCQRGFTLIEIVIVIVVVALLSNILLNNIIVKDKNFSLNDINLTVSNIEQIYYGLISQGAANSIIDPDFNTQVTSVDCSVSNISPLCNLQTNNDINYIVSSSPIDYYLQIPTFTDVFTKEITLNITFTHRSNTGSWEPITSVVSKLYIPQ